MKVPDSLLSNLICRRALDHMTERSKRSYRALTSRSPRVGRCLESVIDGVVEADSSDSQTAGRP
jgi:hypothetical protein